MLMLTLLLKLLVIVSQFHVFNSTVQAVGFPIGISIDVEDFQRLGHAKAAHETHKSTLKEYSRRRLLIGVDRLVYSKSLPHCIRAFSKFYSFILKIAIV